MASPRSVPLWLAVGATLIPAVATASGEPGAGAAVVVTATSAARRCIDLAAGSVAALRSGHMRVVVIVKSFQPPQPPSAALVLSLLDGEHMRHVVGRFGVHPLRAFAADEVQRQQRFVVSLQQHAGRIDAGRPLCLEVAFAASGGTPHGGRAEVEVELADVGAAPLR